MLVEFLLAGVAIAGLLLLFGFFGNEKRIFLIVGAGLILIITGLFIASDATGIEIQTYGGCMNASYEDSLYWNCTSLNYTCTGTPEQDSCAAYTETQCNEIYDCLWSADECTGDVLETCAWLGAYDPTGFKCGETPGCVWEGEPIMALCDEVTITYTYGPCYAESIGFNYTQLIALVLILMGLGLLLGIWQWTKTKEP